MQHHWIKQFLILTSTPHLYSLQEECLESVCGPQLSERNLQLSQALPCLSGAFSSLNSYLSLIIGGRHDSLLHCALLHAYLKPKYLYYCSQLPLSAYTESGPNIVYLMNDLSVRKVVVEHVFFLKDSQRSMYVELGNVWRCWFEKVLESADLSSVKRVCLSRWVCFVRGCTRIIVWRVWMELACYLACAKNGEAPGTHCLRMCV